MSTPTAETGSTLFVGLGKMGEPMVRRYAALHDTVIYDVSAEVARRLEAELGTPALPTLETLPAGVGTVILMLPNSAIVESVLLGSDGQAGMFAALASGSLIIDMGSSKPASTRMLAERAEKLGIDFVDAPVSGGTSKAESGQLSIMMGGTAAARERAAEHVACLGADIVEVGPSGAGHAAKALNNWLSAANLAAAAEVLCIAEQSGIDPAVMVQTLNASTGRSQATEVKYPNHILTGTYASGFAFDLMLKDLRIADDLAHEQGTLAPILASVLQTVENTRAKFDHQDLDHTEVARYYAEENGVTLRGTLAQSPQYTPSETTSTRSGSTE